MEKEDKILSGIVTFQGSAWDRISNEAKDFVSKLLISDPNTRMTGKKVKLSHSGGCGALLVSFALCHLTCDLTLVSGGVCMISLPSESISPRADKAAPITCE